MLEARGEECEGDPSLLVCVEAAESEREPRLDVNPPEQGVKRAGLVSMQPPEVVTEIRGGVGGLAVRRVCTGPTRSSGTWFSGTASTFEVGQFSCHGPH